jgi:hypothetical protein
MIWLSCFYACQLYTGVHCYAWVDPKVAVHWQRGEIDRKNEYADLSKSVLESQGVKNHSFSCKIWTNYGQPRQSVVWSHWIKSYRKSRAASNSSCIFFERHPCLWRATKIVATEVGQVRQLQHPLIKSVFITDCIYGHHTNGYSLHLCLWWPSDSLKIIQNMNHFICFLLH